MSLFNKGQPKQWVGTCPPCQPSSYAAPGNLGFHDFNVDIIYFLEVFSFPNGIMDYSKLFMSETISQAPSFTSCLVKIFQAPMLGTSNALNWGKERKEGGREWMECFYGFLLSSCESFWVLWVPQSSFECFLNLTFFGILWNPFGIVWNSLEYFVILWVPLSSLELTVLRVSWVP